MFMETLDFNYNENEELFMKMKFTPSQNLLRVN